MYSHSISDALHPNFVASNKLTTTKLNVVQLVVKVRAIESVSQTPIKHCASFYFFFLCVPPSIVEWHMADFFSSVPEVTERSATFYVSTGRHCNRYTMQCSSVIQKEFCNALRYTIICTHTRITEEKKKNKVSYKRINKPRTFHSKDLQNKQLASLYL